MDKINDVDLSFIRNYLDNFYTHPIGDLNVNHTDITRIMLNYCLSMKSRNIHLEKNVIEIEDLRFQTFLRIESHILSYHLSIISTKNDIENIINECLTLGYTKDITYTHITNLREVNMRISFVDRLFYTIEYFIQKMNKEFCFIEGSSIHAKSHYFQKMLEFFEIGDDLYDMSELSTSIIDNIPESSKSLIDKIKSMNINKKIKCGKFYEYISVLRNSLHNNGFSNKNMNNLDIGIVRYENIKKDQQIQCLSILHVIVISLILTQILEKVVMISSPFSPKKTITDPSIKVLKSR